MDDDPKLSEAAISDLRDYLVKEWEWGTYPRDRGTVPYEDSAWSALQSYARRKYGTADLTLKAALKEHFDHFEAYRKFTAFDEDFAEERWRHRRPHPVEPGNIVGELRTDGLYRSDPPVVGSAGTEEFLYLRFYADGTVLSGTGTGNEHQAAAWLNKKHWGVEKGQYKREGGKIIFWLGETDYGGMVGVDELRLTSYRRNAGQGTEETYRFAPISAAF